MRETLHDETQEKNRRTDIDHVQTKCHHLFYSVDFLVPIQFMRVFPEDWKGKECTDKDHK